MCLRSCSSKNNEARSIFCSVVKPGWTIFIDKILIFLHLRYITGSWIQLTYSKTTLFFIYNRSLDLPFHSLKSQRFSCGRNDYGNAFKSTNHLLMIPWIVLTGLFHSPLCLTAQVSSWGRRCCLFCSILLTISQSCLFSSLLGRAVSSSSHWVHLWASP